MRVHSWHTLGWIIWAVTTLAFFALWEYIGLRDRLDDKQPLTYFIRKMVGTWNNPVWWVLLALLSWMIVHFLIIHDKR